MGRHNLKHIDRGIIYLPIYHNMDESEIGDLIEKYKHTGKTIVLLRSGKYDMKNILKELIKTRLDT